MKRITFLFFFIFSVSEIHEVSAQSGSISSDGVYVPRLTTANRNAIATPANGQLIYNTDNNCFNVFQNGAWQKLSGFNPPPSDTWTKKTDMSDSIGVASIGFSIGNKGYIGLGGINTKPWQSDFWEYDPSGSVWTQKADFAGGFRTNAIGFAIGSKGYAGLGNADISKDDFWEYDPATNTWTQKANFAGGPRSYAVGFSINNKGYAGTGLYSGLNSDFWEYDPTTDGWTQKAYFGGGSRSGAVGFSIGNKGYIGTGYSTNTTPLTRHRDFWEFNPATNVWTKKADFGGEARTDAVGFSINNKGYIGTGSKGATSLNDFWEFNITTNSWTQKINFSGGYRFSSVGFSIGDKGYIGGGAVLYAPTFEMRPFNDFWEYKPDYVPNNLTTQGNVFNGPNQLLQLNSVGNITGNLSINGNVTISGKLNPENFIAPTLLNGWANHSPAAGYYIDKESRVRLKGTIKNGTVTSGTVLFNLPVGYRPSEVMMFAVTNSTVPLGRIDVFPNGDVKIMSGGNTLLSLDGISFRVN